MEAILQEIQTAVEGIDEVSTGLNMTFAIILKSKNILILEDDQQETLKLLCLEVLMLPLLDENPQEVLSDLILKLEENQTSPRQDELDDFLLDFIVYTFLFCLGKSWRLGYDRLLDKDESILYNLKQIIMSNPVEKYHSLAVNLMFELLQTRELSFDELETVIDELFTGSLLRFIEVHRQDRYEMHNYDVIRLILACNAQFMRKNSARAYTTNNIETVLIKRIDKSKTLSENLIFMFNRSSSTPSELTSPISVTSLDDPGRGRAEQILLLKFLYKIFNVEELREFFFTNDLKIILDIIIRELLNCTDDELEYLYVLKPLLYTISIRRITHKCSEVKKVLSMIKNDYNVKIGTRTVANAILRDEYMK